MNETNPKISTNLLKNAKKLNELISHQIYHKLKREISNVQTNLANGCKIGRNVMETDRKFYQTGQK
jgi:hypothetical protein